MTQSDDKYPDDETQTDVRIKLSKELKAAVATLKPHEVRFLVDYYYQAQDNRIRTAGQVRAMETTGETKHAILDWLFDKNDQFEKQIRVALGAYSESHPVGRWSRSVVGIGPVIAAGLLAHIDITKAPTVGHIWKFAGLDPTSKWNKGEKRPWNAALKVICWKAGESFVKVSGNETAVYGKYYVDRKRAEATKNDAGNFAEQARSNVERVGKTTDAWAWYAGCYPGGTFTKWLELADAKAREKFLKESKVDPDRGVNMLPPGHIQARARRYAVKLFLSHWHEVAYQNHYGKAPPLPYPIAILGHAHKSEPLT